MLLLKQQWHTPGRETVKTLDQLKLNLKSQLRQQPVWSGLRREWSFWELRCCFFKNETLLMMSLFRMQINANACKKSSNMLHLKMSPPSPTASGLNIRANGNTDVCTVKPGLFTITYRICELMCIVGFSMHFQSPLKVDNLTVLLWLLFDAKLL